ncbi:membrane protein insertion efficiency factor YidD [Acetobacteraceae bacterium]|nr:membrane protein insertion efficiency factor YidD [Acetobacteraceae bacterium]
MFKYIFLLFLKIYRFCVSPILGNNCRFYPTCSAYAYSAIQTYGVLRGGYLTIRRLLKCHPWHPGGFDPPV